MYIMVEDFFKSRIGILFISIVWGLGLATLFRKSCDGINCKVIEYHGPNIEDRNAYWRYGNEECYQWSPYIISCNN